MLPPNLFHARTVVEDVRVTDTLTSLRANHPRIDDAWEGIKWRLARGPEEGYEVVSGKYLMRFPSFVNIVDVPSLTVLYEFNNDQVRVFGLGVDI